MASLWPAPSRAPGGADRKHEARMRHIRVVALLASGNWDAEQLARLEGVHRDTIYDWRRRVLHDYDDPEAVGLRRMLGLDRAPAAG